jgi:hypothetical protein
VKHLQKFPHNAPAHKAHYGMRSLVESSNKTLKEKRFEDMSNTSKRSGRGFAFNYVATALMAVSSNLRKIAQFFRKLARRDHGEKLPRERRRKNATRTPLATPTNHPALAPPR